jgi:hypothetical protein
MDQLVFVVDLLVWSFLSGFVGVIVGQLLPSRVASLRVATWIFLAAWAVLVTTAVVMLGLATFVGDPNQYVPVWLVAGALLSYFFAAGITRGIDIRAAGYWRWFPRTPVLKN